MAGFIWVDIKIVGQSLTGKDRWVGNSYTTNPLFVGFLDYNLI